MTSWTRPSTHPPPRVWRRIPGFVIQDLPPEREEEAIEHCAKFFLRDEPCCKSLGLVNETESREEFINLLRECLPFRISLACIEESTNKLAAVNILRVATAKDSQEEIDSFNKLVQQTKGEQVKKMFNLLILVYQKADPYKYFGVNAILDSMALSTDPAYRNNGIATHMVWARLELAKALGIPASKSIFTSIYSQSIAAKAGMDNLAEVRFDEYVNPDGSRILGDTSPHPSAKLMVGLIPKTIPQPLQKK